MAFHVGQKVECIDDERMLGCIKKGDQFTISQVLWHDLVGEYLTFHEIIAPRGYCGFHAVCFRPVVERKTDISIFKAMLNPSQVTVEAMNLADFARELVK